MALIAPVRAIVLFLLSWLVGSAAAGNPLLNPEFEGGGAPWTQGPTPKDILKVSVAAPPIAAGLETTCAVTNTGGVLCWGDLSYGGLSTGAINGVYISLTIPTAVVGLSSGVTAIASGPSSHSTCAITSAGGLICWGYNGDGELGNGTIAEGTVPTPVAGLTSGVKAVATGNTHTCAATADGQVFCWGGDEYGQLGDGGKGYGNYSDLPVKVVGLSSAVTAIAAGDGNTCVVTVSGGVLCWGYNGEGELGNGTTTNSSVPVAVTGLSSGVVAIAAGGDHTCALTAAGGVLCWGLNIRGDLGTPNSSSVPAPVTGRSSVPVPVTGLSSGVVAIATGGEHTCALTAAGGVLCWGENVYGQLGNGATVDSSVPVAVSGLSSGVAAIVAGGAHTCAVTTMGTVLCWGFNSAGALGDGTFAHRLTPVIVHHQDGTGSFAANNWFLDLAPGSSKASTEIPSALIPTFLTIASGNAATAVVSVKANVQFRAQDVGNPIYVFGYVPASLLGAARTKGSSTCVLAQLTSSGQLQQASASGLQSYTSNVISSQGQAINLLNNVSAANVVGSTFCVGTATSSSQAVNAGNSVCVATVPNASASPCAAPNSSVVVANVPGALSGLWWNATESGWGIDFTQRGNNMFAAWYTYDAAGNPKWYVASNCTGASTSSGTCSGTLYEVNGPTFFGASFNPSLVNVVAAGNLTVNFQSTSNASMTYTVGTQSRTVAITRQPVGTGSIPPAIDYTDLWWNPSESGWGMTMAQQFNNIFLAWYVYDGSGKPVWYVASNCAVSGSSCTGTLYRTTGPAFGPTFDSTKIQVFPVGSATVTFTDPNNAALSYTVDGVSATKTITRQLF